MKRLFRRIAALLLALIVCLAIVFAPILNEGYQMYRDAVSMTPVSEKIKQVKDSDDYVPIEEISENFKENLIKSEDRRFYGHLAVDPIALIRAVIANINSGKYIQGGSTITQQLAKNMYFSFEKELPRKIAEVFVALELERQCTKDEILAMYCSLVYFGENCYGIKSASRYYYNVLPSELNEEQSIRLVETLKAPSVNNPFTQ